MKSFSKVDPIEGLKVRLEHQVDALDRHVVQHGQDLDALRPGSPLIFRAWLFFLAAAVLYVIGVWAFPTLSALILILFGLFSFPMWLGIVEVYAPSHFRHAKVVSQRRKLCSRVQKTMSEIEEICAERVVQ